MPYDPTTFKNLYPFPDTRKIKEGIEQKIHSQIWEDGHSSGYGDMENMYYDWVPVILQAFNNGFNNAPTKQYENIFR